MFSGADAPWHWLILAIVVVALFGYKKLPDAARSLGRSMRIFKTEIKGMSEDDAARAATKAEIVPPAQPATPPSEVTDRPVATPVPPDGQSRVEAPHDAENRPTA
jgi:sec-independent protein translocase protein TatA